MPIDSQDGSSREGDGHPSPAENTVKVSFMSLLKRPPMAVLCFVRLTDPLATTSIYVSLRAHTNLPCVEVG